jgi:Cytochrome c553
MVLKAMPELVPIYPKLAGQSEGYLLKQLRDFKSGARKDGIMLGMVAPLSDADMANIAAYYSAQTTTKGMSNKNAKVFTLGQKIYRGGKKHLPDHKQITACIACHGPNGKGISTAGFPALASQNASYTAKQLKAFRQESLNAQTGTTAHVRDNDYESMMRRVARNLTNEEIDAVSRYISGLN